MGRVAVAAHHGLECFLGGQSKSDCKQLVD